MPLKLKGKDKNAVFYPVIEIESKCECSYYLIIVTEPFSALLNCPL